MDNSPSIDPRLLDKRLSGNLSPSLYQTSSPVARGFENRHDSRSGEEDIDLDPSQEPTARQDSSDQLNLLGLFEPNADDLTNLPGAHQGSKQESNQARFEDVTHGDSGGLPRASHTAEYEHYSMPTSRTQHLDDPWNPLRAVSPVTVGFQFGTSHFPQRIRNQRTETAILDNQSRTEAVSTLFGNGSARRPCDFMEANFDFDQAHNSVSHNGHPIQFEATSEDQSQFQSGHFEYTHPRDPSCGPETSNNQASAFRIDHGQRVPWHNRIDSGIALGQTGSWSSISSAHPSHGHFPYAGESSASQSFGQYPTVQEQILLVETGIHLSPGSDYFATPNQPCLDSNRMSGEIFSFDEEKLHQEHYSSTTDLSPESPPCHRLEASPSDGEPPVARDMPGDYQSNQNTNHSWPRVSGPMLHYYNGSHRSTVALRPATEIRKRDRRHTTSALPRGVSPRPLQFVHENGQGRSISTSALTLLPGRARRCGRLPEAKRQAAADRRKEKSVCIRCHQTKQRCSGESPCDRCRDLGKAPIWEQPCTKAHFLEIIESGICNYISQRAINHLTLDQTRRVRMELPQTFELDELLSLVDSRRQLFNIRARQASGSLYVLDLNECHRYLKAISRKQASSTHDLREFIDHKILNADKWLKCVTDCDPMNGILALLSQWNNMPSRASYYFVSKDGRAPDRPMNVENPEDQVNILIAAQLSRIVCRKLEVAGFKALQNALNKWATDPPEDSEVFVAQLGHVLLTLRWRVSWWKEKGDGGTLPDSGKEQFEHRVDNLCLVLYFYYCNVRKKLRPWSNPQSLDGVFSRYADAAPVFDDLPCSESIEGFHAWMERGRDLIRIAVPQRS